MRIPRFFLTWLFAALFALSATVSQAAEPAAPLAPAALSVPLSVHIVPTSYREGQPRALDLAGQKHFHVVLTNTGGAPLKLWREWCSWGYFNLSFEAKDETGAVTKIVKIDPGWGKNFPDWTTLAAGDSMVFEVDFAPSVWHGAPLPAPGKSGVVQLRAVFESRDSAEAKADGIWVGRAVSSDDTYKLYR